MTASLAASTAVTPPPKRILANNSGGPTGVKIVAAAATPNPPETIPVALLPNPTLLCLEVFCSRARATSSMN